jgi:hypothetical protein
VRVAKEPKYAPARADGLKPWYVEVIDWGRKSERIVYAKSRADAEYRANGRLRYMSARARRATPDDIRRLTPTTDDLGPSPSSGLGSSAGVSE